MGDPWRGPGGRSTGGDVLRTRAGLDENPRPPCPWAPGHAPRHSPAPGSPPGGSLGGGGGAAAPGRPEGLTGSAAPPLRQPRAACLSTRLPARPEAEVAPVSEAPAWRKEAEAAAAAAAAAEATAAVATRRKCACVLDRGCRRGKPRPLPVSEPRKLRLRSEYPLLLRAPPTLFRHRLNHAPRANLTLNPHPHV